MNKLILVGLLVCGVLCMAQGLNEDAWYGKHEAACVSQGGLCIAQSECMRRIGREGELCAQQAAQGFQCCANLPKNEKRCGMHGGQCVQAGSCNEIVVYSEATDCGVDQTCCIFM